MKILEYGKLPLEIKTIYIGKCANCGCKLECDESDEINGVSFCGSEKTYNPNVKCPTTGCYEYISLKEKKVKEKPNPFR